MTYWQRLQPGLQTTKINGEGVQLIKTNRAQFPARILCETLGVSHSGYYDWENAKPASTLSPISTIKAKACASTTPSPAPPAQQAGLQPGDILIQLAGQPVSGLASYAAILRSLKAGEKVELKFRRNGDERLIEITLVER